MKKREKCVLNNIIYSSLYTIVSSVFPFIVKALLVRHIGLEYLGVNSLFVSILQIVNILDFNISGALNSYFFKAGAENDLKALNMYMKILRAAYRIIGAGIIVVGILLSPFLKFLVLNNAYPSGLNIYYVFFIFVLQSSLSYFFGYQFSVHMAFLRAHVVYLYMMVGLFVSYMFQIISIIFFKNYYIYTTSFIICPIVAACILFFNTRKRYPWLNYIAEIDKGVLGAIKKNVVAVFLSKLRNVSRNSFDSVIISSFLGLTILARYQNYYQLMTVPLLISEIVKSSIMPSLGNSIAQETKESNLGVLNLYTLMQNAVSTICVVCLLCLVQPFMQFWMGAENVLSYDTVVLISIYYYVLSVAETSGMLRETTGVWWQGSYIAVIEAVLNLILNILLVHFFGYKGVILASILTVVFINIPCELYFVFHNYFNGGWGKYLLKLFYYALITGLIAFVSCILCLKIEILNLNTLIIRFSMTILVPVFLYCVLYLKNENFREILRILIRMFSSIFNRRTFN